MNRRDFLGLFRGLAILPFVKLPATPETLTDSEVEEIRELYEGLTPDASRITFDQSGSWGVITNGHKFYSLLDLDTLPGDYSYSLSISPLHDTFDFSSKTPLDTVYQEGDFISVWVDGHLLREGYVQTAGKYGFTLVSPFASLAS